MGESQQEPLSLEFDARVRLEFVGSKITSDAGLLAHRELDEKLGLTDMADQFLRERRTGRNIQHELGALLRQSVYSRLAGYPDTNDADRLARDPTMRLVVSRRASDWQAAARNTVGRFETEILAAEGNREGLAAPGLPARRSASTWKSTSSCMPSGCRPTPRWGARLTPIWRAPRCWSLANPW